MTSQQISFDLTPGLLEEIWHLDQEKALIYSSMEELNLKTENSPYQGTVLELNSRLSAKSTVLDIGCGFGETSLLLAHFGHTVHSIEPSKNRITALLESSKKMHLPIHPYLCTGESLDKASLPKMDGCLFCSSLHHCDDPLNALKKAKNILKPNGVIVLNEPILRFYRSKKWFQKQLIENPIKIGHYGGNEHIYYFKEYYSLLKTAGFTNIQFCWSNKNIDPRKTLINDLDRKCSGHYQHTIGRCLIKYGIHRIVKTLSDSPITTALMISPLLRSSLLQAIFIASA